MVSSPCVVNLNFLAWKSLKQLIRQSDKRLPELHHAVVTLPTPGLRQRGGRGQVDHKLLEPGTSTLEVLRQRLDYICLYQVDQRWLERLAIGQQFVRKFM